MKVETPVSHRNDPATSYIAEQAINESGSRLTNQQTITQVVKWHPGKTAAELGEITGLGQHESCRRLSELCNITVERGDRRKCAIKGSQMMVWYPIGTFEKGAA